MLVREFGMKRIVLAAAIAAACTSSAFVRRRRTNHRRPSPGDRRRFPCRQRRAHPHPRCRCAGEWAILLCEGRERRSGRVALRQARGRRALRLDRRTEDQLRHHSARESTRAGWHAVRSTARTWRNGSRPTAGPSLRRTASARSFDPPRIRRRQRGWASGPAPSRCRGSGARRASGFPTDRETVRPRSGRSVCQR